MLSVANKPIMLSVVMPNVIMLSIILPNVVMLSIILPNVVMLSVVMPNVVMTSVVMPNVVMTSVVLLNVVAPSVRGIGSSPLNFVEVKPFQLFFIFRLTFEGRLEGQPKLEDIGPFL
jgi:hypothetical protein